MYTRKTKDIYEVNGNYGYGHGFEYLIAYDNYKDARDCLRLYRINLPEGVYKIVKIREKI